MSIVKTIQIKKLNTGYSKTNKCANNQLLCYQTIFLGKRHKNTNKLCLVKKHYFNYLLSKLDFKKD
jgi:hypothetical protein